MRELTLEMSLKPFKEKSDEYIDAIIRGLFQQWSMLIKRFDSIAVLLWTSDGSELLDYTGDMGQTFEWAKYIGRANEFEGDWNREKDPLRLSPHARRYLYTKDPVEFTYADLQAIVLAIKTIGSSVAGKPVRVGTTLDPGPEFAESSFKYSRHPEICTAGSMGAKSFMVSYEKLHADDYPYCAYPTGVPEGLSLATFLGAQASCFLRDMGMDYIWLSNGFGFGAENWSTTGPLFDGGKFSEDSERIEEIRQKTLRFWEEFRAACPSFEVQTRGTNLTTGIDFATDGCALKAIYDGGFDMVPPPNSPWAALDKNFGLEIAGFLSRIAELPNDSDYMFRYYLHDPWWINSPWFDRYEGEPHDIYLPFALSRVDAEGNVECPSRVNILSVDTSLGEMPDDAVATVTPHLLRSLDTLPDCVSQFLWVYPFREYQEADGGEYRLGRSFFEDWFMVGAINDGLPVPSVVSSDHFVDLVNGNPKRFSETVLYVPVPEADSSLERALIDHCANGGSAIVYGSLSRAGKSLLETLGVRLTDPVFGSCEVEQLGFPEFASEEPSRRFTHDPVLSDGGIDTVPAPGAASRPLTMVSQAGQSRVFSVEASVGQGTLVWVRGTNGHTVEAGSHLLRPNLRSSRYITCSEMRFALSLLGVGIHFESLLPDAPHPVFVVHRHSGGFYFSGYCRDTTVGWRMSTPLGAPVPIGHEVVVEGATGSYHFPRAFRRECRVFVEQESGVVSMTEYGPVSAIMRRRMLVEGLCNATVYVFPENGRPEKCELLLNSTKPNSTGEPFDYELMSTVWGKAYRVSGVTGHLLVSTEFDDVSYLEGGLEMEKLERGERSWK